MSLMNMKQEELSITIIVDGVNSVCFLGNLPLSECDTADVQCQVPVQLPPTP